MLPTKLSHQVLGSTILAFLCVSFLSLTSASAQDAVSSATEQSPADAQGYKVEEVKNPGTILGRVFFGGDFPSPEPFQVPGIYTKHCGTTRPNEEFIVSAKNKGLKYAVVYIEDIKAGKPFPKVAAKLEQKDCHYEPHVQVVPAGTTIEIINQDNTLHNVHSYLDPDGKRSTLFNIAQPMKGKKDSKTLAEEGIVKVECDIHRWMSAFVIVRDNPYYALTKADGSYEITGVPPGTYRLVMWQEGLGKGEKTVVVKSGEATEVPFQIGKSDEDAAADKSKKGKGGQ